MLNAAQFRTAVQTYFPKNDSLLLNANTNWFDLVDRTAMGQQHDVALSGAGSNNSYRLSLGYSNQDGILKGTTAQRISLGVGYDQQLYDGRLDLRANLKGSRTLDQFTPGGVLYNAAQMGPTQPVYDSTSATGYANWAAGNPLTSADNPVEVLNLAKDHGTTYRSVGNVQAKYDFSSFQPLRGLTGTVNLGYDITDVNRVTFYPNNIHLETKNGTDGSYYRTAPSQTNTVLETYLDYRPPANLGPGNLGLTGGYSYARSHAQYSSISAVQLNSNLLGDNGIPPTGIAPVPIDTVTESKLISFFGRAEYNIGDRYLATVSVRRDGSSRFGPGTRWGNFAWDRQPTPNLICTVPVAAGSNLSNYVTTNSGSMRNWGFELDLNARLLDGGPGGLSWTAGFNATHNANELLRINPNAAAASQILVGDVAGGVGTKIQ